MNVGEGLCGVCIKEYNSRVKVDAFLLHTMNNGMNAIMVIIVRVIIVIVVVVVVIVMIIMITVTRKKREIVLPVPVNHASSALRT